MCDNIFSHAITQRTNDEGAVSEFGFFLHQNLNTILVGTPNSIMSPGGARGTPSKAKQRDFIDLTVDEDYGSSEKVPSTIKPHLSQV